MKKIPVMKPFFDDKEEKAVLDVIRSGWVAQGPKVEEFENLVAKHENTAFGVATTSCTTALQLAMEAHGMGEGMDVIVPSFTFVATANAVVSTGATPVLTDIRQDTYTIDPDCIRKKISDDYREKDGRYIHKQSGRILWGIVPVHQFGLCADMESINQIAKEKHLAVIEDAACALGADIYGVHEGGFGNTACISFHPRKSITTGEGGMVLTNDKALAEKMCQLRNHGSTVSAEKRETGKGFLLPQISEAGFNYRMNDMQAAMGIEQIKKLDYIINERRKLAHQYNEMITSEIPELFIPYVPKGYRHTYQSYVCMLNYKSFGTSSIQEGGNIRNHLLELMENEGISTRQGTHAVHLLDYYANTYQYKYYDCPNAYACDRLSITLPLYIPMSEEQMLVIKALKSCIEKIKKDGMKNA